MSAVIEGAAGAGPRAGRREWVGLAMLALRDVDASRPDMRSTVMSPAGVLTVIYGLKQFAVECVAIVPALSIIAT